MTIEHRDIVDPNIHEPKGISTAASGRVYVANGSGGGAWDFPALQGQSASPDNRVPVKSGAGVLWKAIPGTDPAYCEMNKAETIISLTSVTELIQNGFSFSTDTVVSKFTLASGQRLTFVDPGVYFSVYSFQFKPQSALGANNEVINIISKRNGVIENIGSITITRNSAIDDVFNIDAHNITTVSAGDYFEIFLSNQAATRTYKVSSGIRIFRFA